MTTPTGDTPPTTWFDRPMIEAAIRNGADISAAEAAALLAERDRLARGANGDCVDELRAVRAEADRAADAGLAEQDRRVAAENRIARAVSILSGVERDDDIDEYGGAIDDALAALRGEM